MRLKIFLSIHNILHTFCFDLKLNEFNVYIFNYLFQTSNQETHFWNWWVPFGTEKWVMFCITIFINKARMYILDFLWFEINHYEVGPPVLQTSLVITVPLFDISTNEQITNALIVVIFLWNISHNFYEEKWNDHLNILSTFIEAFHNFFTFVFIFFNVFFVQE